MPLRALPVRACPEAEVGDALGLRTLPAHGRRRVTRATRIDPQATPDLDALEEAIGYRFNDRGLLVVAVTHRSFAHEVVDGSCRDNEPFEFLGDAVLAFVVADRLFREFPGLDEGRLSKHKSVIEKSGTLAEAARELGIGVFLRLGRGEQKAGGAANEKILSDAFEALVAAIYLDGGLAATAEFIDRALGQRLRELDRANPITDFKSALQEATQAIGLGTPVYRVLSETGPDHDKKFRVVVSIDGSDVAEGAGSTKRGAHQLAAQSALAILRGLSPRPAEASGGDADVSPA
jgi:ribonuclease-3